MLILLFQTQWNVTLVFETRWNAFETCLKLFEMCLNLFETLFWNVFGKKWSKHPFHLDSHNYICMKFLWPLKSQFQFLVMSLPVVYPTDHYLRLTQDLLNVKKLFSPPRNQKVRQWLKDQYLPKQLIQFQLRPQKCQSAVKKLVIDER